MTLRFTIPFLDLEFFRVELDIERDEPGSITTLDKGIKKMSGWWVGRMNR